MKLRYHIDREKDGLVILESEPQVRTIFVVSQLRNNIRVPFPHIIFTIRYEKLDDKFVYPGIYRSGLCVYGKLKPLNKLSDEVIYLPTDYIRKGLVCTNHSYDSKKFDSLKELVNFVVALWWSMSHMVEYQPFKKLWNESDLKDLKSANWEKHSNLSKSLVEKKDYGNAEQRKISELDEVLDVEWPIQLTTQPYKIETEAKPEPEIEDDADDDAYYGCDCDACRADR